MTVLKLSKKKPPKPSKSFPLWPHANGQWAKRIRGKVHFFGVWRDPEAARRRYLEQAANLEAGRDSLRVKHDKSLSLGEAINAYLTELRRLVSCGEVKEDHFSDVKLTVALIVGGKPTKKSAKRKTTIDHRRLLADLSTVDFARLKEAFGKKLDQTDASPGTRAGHIRRTRALFSWLWQSDLVAEPVKLGPRFGKTTAKEREFTSRRAASKLLTAEQIRVMVDGASPDFKAMILMGINAAMASTAVSRLEVPDLKLSSNWLDAYRPKTGVRRAAWLWPETIKAISPLLVRNRCLVPPDVIHLVFHTRRGRDATAYNKQSIAKRWSRLRKRSGLDISGFSSLRHTFRTIATQVGEREEVDWVMGHSRESGPVSRRYTHEAPIEKVTLVCKHVHDWLFGVENEET